MAEPPLSLPFPTVLRAEEESGVATPLLRHRFGELQADPAWRRLVIKMAGTPQGQCDEEFVQYLRPQLQNIIAHTASTAESLRVFDDHALQLLLNRDSKDMYICLMNPAGQTMDDLFPHRTAEAFLAKMGYERPEDLEMQQYRREVIDDATTRLFSLVEQVDERRKKQQQQPQEMLPFMEHIFLPQQQLRDEAAEAEAMMWRGYEDSSAQPMMEPELVQYSVMTEEQKAQLASHFQACLVPWDFYQLQCEWPEKRQWIVKAIQRLQHHRRRLSYLEWAANFADTAEEFDLDTPSFAEPPGYRTSISPEDELLRQRIMRMHRTKQGMHLFGLLSLRNGRCVLLMNVYGGFEIPGSLSEERAAHRYFHYAVTPLAVGRGEILRSVPVAGDQRLFLLDPHWDSVLQYLCRPGADWRRVLQVTLLLFHTLSHDVTVLEQQPRPREELKKWVDQVIVFYKKTTVILPSRPSGPELDSMTAVRLLLFFLRRLLYDTRIFRAVFCGQ